MNDRRVLKWIITVDDDEHRIPGRLLAAASSPHSNEINVWTLVVGDPGTAAPTTPYRIFGTGHPIAWGAAWVATVQAPPFVWHLFRTGPSSEPYTDQPCSP